MNKSLQVRDIPNDVTVTPQKELFVRFSILLLKIARFLVVFSSVKAKVIQ